LRLPAADFIDHRPYSPGDDQRHIDWPAAARHDALFVKVGRASQSTEVHVLLDISPSMAADGAKWRLSRELTAALAWMSLAQGDRVTVTGFATAATVTSWGPASGSAQGAGLISYLSKLEPAEVPGTRLKPVVQSVARGRPAGGLLVLVSDLWLMDDLEDALGLVPSPRWEALVLQVLGREELTPVLDGAFDLRDVESGERLTLVIDDSVRAEYRSALNARLERVRAAATRRGAGYAMLPGDWQLERAVIPYLQRRAVLTT
jgi:uncharacterized protein (DUF58 family)